MLRRMLQNTQLDFVRIDCDFLKLSKMLSLLLKLIKITHADRIEQNLTDSIQKRQNHCLFLTISSANR